MCFFGGFLSKSKKLKFLSPHHPCLLQLEVRLTSVHEDSEWSWVIIHTVHPLYLGYDMMVQWLMCILYIHKQKQSKLDTISFRRCWHASIPMIFHQLEWTNMRTYTSYLRIQAQYIVYREELEIT